MSAYAMSENKANRMDIGREASRIERTPQVREQLDYLTKATDTLSAEVQRILAKIAPVQRQEPKVMAKEDGDTGPVGPSSPVAGEMHMLVRRIEAIIRDVSEGADLLEV